MKSFGAKPTRSTSPKPWAPRPWAPRSWAPRPTWSSWPARPATARPSQSSDQRSGGGGFAKKQRKVFKNDDIKAPRILLIDDAGEKVGPLPRLKALSMAEEQGLDLVQMGYNPEEQVATARIVDFGKYMYDKKKEETDKKKKQKQKGQKEIKFGYGIGDNDLALKIKKAQEFLEDGYSVKMMAVLKWREKAYKEHVRVKFIDIEQQLITHGKSLGVKDEIFGYTLVLLSKK